MFTILNITLKCINFRYIFIMVTGNTIAPKPFDWRKAIYSDGKSPEMKSSPMTQMRSVFDKRNTTPDINAQGPLEKPEKQPGGKFDAFHAYIDEQLGDAGFSKSGSDNKSGWVAQSGRFKGRTQDEARAELRKEFAGLDPRRKTRYASLAEGRDVQAPGIVERPNLMAQEQAGAERLLNETGDLLSREGRGRELGNLDMGVRTGTVGEKTSEAKPTVNVPGVNLTDNQMKRMSERSSMSYAPGSSV